MPIFYTVSGTIWNPGEIISFIPESDWYEIKPVSLYSKEDVMYELEHIYEKKLSQHGVSYLLQHHPYLNYDNKSWIHYETMLEQIYELVRQAEFPSRPSRFQSIFGCTSIEDAKIFKNKYRPPHFEIFEVEVNKYFIADMKYLGVGFVFGGTMHIAKNYWKGEKSNTPFMEVIMKLPVKVLNKCT